MKITYHKGKLSGTTYAHVHGEDGFFESLFYSKYYGRFDNTRLNNSAHTQYLKVSREVSADDFLATIPDGVVSNHPRIAEIVEEIRKVKYPQMTEKVVYEVKYNKHHTSIYHTKEDAERSMEQVKKQNAVDKIAEKFFLPRNIINDIINEYKKETK